MIRGLYAIVDSEELAAAVLAGGCRLLQLRIKGQPREAILPVAHAVAARCREVGATFIVNDDARLAVEVDADGVHVGMTDAPTPEVRRIVGRRLIGRSTNGLEHIAGALPDADYLAFGPLFATANLSRPKAVQGVELLRQARERVPSIPLVGIGGITAARLRLVRPWVDSWAVIGAIRDAEDPTEATRGLL